MREIKLVEIFGFKPFCVDVMGYPEKPYLVVGQKIRIPTLDDTDEINKLRPYAKNALVDNVSDNDLVEVAIGQINSLFDIIIEDNVIQITGYISEEERMKRFQDLENKYTSVYKMET